MNQQKLSEAINSVDIFQPNKTARSVFIAGIKYSSLFLANTESGIRSVSIWKAMKHTDGGPVQIRKSFVVMESWVTARADALKRNYKL